MIRLLAITLFLGLAACGGGGQSRPATERDLSDIELTWYQAVVAVPPIKSGDKVTLVRMAQLLADPPVPAQPLPTVIYLHGCNGLDDMTILKVLASAGYLVIAPDSMARHYRPMQCDPATGRGGANTFVFDFRQTELTYAIHNTARLAWADSTNMFLLGGSEGGVAAALYRGDAFRGRVIAAWTCHGAPIVAGLDSQPMEPVLSIVSIDDPWYNSVNTVGQGGDCGAYMAGRPNAHSIVLPPGEGHAVLGNVSSQRAILDFLATWSRH